MLAPSGTALLEQRSSQGRRSLWRVGTSSTPWAAAMVDVLLVLSRSLPGAKTEGMLPHTLDVLLAGTSSAQGAAFVVAGGSLDLVASRGLTPGLRNVLQRLPLT